MPRNSLWRIVPIAVLCVALTAPARAESLDTAVKQVIAGIVVVSAGTAVLITVLIVRHNNKKSAMTGCVASGATGMSVTDEKDKRIYAVSGDPIGIRAGNRMTLEGQRKTANNTLVFQAHRVTKDLGACPL